MDRLQGKVALVTGAAQGLGRAMAEKFVSQGAKVFATDLNLEKLDAWASGEPNIRTMAQDVVDEDLWTQVVEETAKAFGKLHILVNNAGIGTLGTVESTEYKEWKKVLAVDLDSVFLGSKAAIPLLKESSTAELDGSIINISSVAGVVAAADFVAYNAAKAAVIHTTKSTALHLAKEKSFVRCNAILPVFTKTPILDNFVHAMGGDEVKVHGKLAKQIPMGRLAEPEDVANAALFLASNESRMITGSQIVIDGGVTAG